MINQVNYTINTAEGPIRVTITPVNQLLSDGDYYNTGVYKLSDGPVGMGEVIFDKEMNSWRYEGLDELTYLEAQMVAEFIKNYDDPEGADPSLL